MSGFPDRINFPCEHCGAEPGQPCRTRDGWRAGAPHVSRIIQENEAWKRRDQS